MVDESGRLYHTREAFTLNKTLARIVFLVLIVCNCYQMCHPLESMKEIAFSVDTTSLRPVRARRSR